MPAAKKPNRYAALIEKVFFDRYNDGDTSVPFIRSELIDAAAELGIKLPKNIGDSVYSFRYRIPLPDSILRTRRDEREWVIIGTGRAKYEFRLQKINRIEPDSKLAVIDIPDATPRIVETHALSDEQALLAKVRYNRLLDIFLGMATYSLQSHLRTTVRGVGQIEIDELYVGIDKDGEAAIIPVQAKGGTDQLGVVQTSQDIACCKEKFPGLTCRAISTQFLSNDTVVLFELAERRDEIVLIQERHYRLVSKS